MMLRKGDRFRWKIKGDVWEYVSDSHYETEFPHLAVCLDSGNCKYTKVGEEETWDFTEGEMWEFIGNFNKASNFNNLYDKLSRTTDR